MNSGVVGVQEAGEEVLEISVPLESVGGEESFVVDGNINNHNVEVGDDFFGFDGEFVSPEDGEFFNSDFMFVDDSRLSRGIDAKIVMFEFSNGALGLLDDFILVFNKDGGLFGFTLSNDLESIGFDLDEGISSEDKDLSVNIGINFKSHIDDQ